MSTKTTKPAKSSAHDVKTFADHLGELRWRLALIAIVLVVASSLAYYVREWLVNIVLSPIGHQKLVYLTPAGGFSFIFQITLYAGMLATAPVLIYHLYRFVAPALPVKTRKYSLRVISASTALLAAGVSFGYFVAIPAALQFLTQFAGEFVEANLTADSYLNFVVAYLLGLGLLFQLPLLLVFWNWIKPFDKGELLNTQRFVLVGAFIAAAMITPTPDVVNQCLIAVPIVAIYQLGVIAVFFTNRKNRRATKRAERPARVHSQRARVASPTLARPVTPVVVAPVQQQPKPVIVAIKPSPVRRRVVSMDGMTRSPVRRPVVTTRSAPVRPQPSLQQTVRTPMQLNRPSQPSGGTRILSLDGVSRIS